MHCSRVRGDWAGNWELKVHFLHFFETIAKSEFIISGVRVNSRTFWNSDFIFGTFPKQLRSQSSFSDLGGTWSSDNRNSAKLRVQPGWRWLAMAGRSWRSLAVAGDG